MLLLLITACGQAGYDVDSWRSPLASAFDGVADAAVGQDLFYSETWGDEAVTPMSCTSCHGMSAEDTLTDDEGALDRPGHTVWNAPYRGLWWGEHPWDAGPDDDALGAFGGQACVSAYFPEGAELLPEQAADLEAFMKTLMDADAPRSDPRAEPLDYAFMRWDTEADFLASIADGAGGYLRGEALGDVLAGEAATNLRCATCHATETTYNAVFEPLEGVGVPALLSRIRRVEVDGVVGYERRMPGFPADRLPDDALRDILAYLTQYAGEE